MAFFLLLLFFVFYFSKIAFKCSTVFSLPNNSIVSPNSGPITIGEGAKVGAAAVVLQNIPANATAVGIPAKIVRVDGVKIKEENNDSTV